MSLNLGKFRDWELHWGLLVSHYRDPLARCLTLEHSKAKGKDMAYQVLGYQIKNS